MCGGTCWTAASEIPLSAAHSLSSCSHVPRHSRTRPIRAAARLMPLAHPGTFLPGGHAFAMPAQTPGMILRSWHGNVIQARRARSPSRPELQVTERLDRRARAEKQLTRGRVPAQALASCTHPVAPTHRVDYRMPGRITNEASRKAFRSAFQPHPSNAPHPAILSVVPSVHKRLSQSKTSRSERQDSLSMKRKCARAAAARP